MVNQLHFDIKAKIVSCVLFFFIIQCVEGDPYTLILHENILFNLGNRFWFCVKWARLGVHMHSNLITKPAGLSDNYYASEPQTVLNSTTKPAKSKSISILTLFSLKNEWKVLDYFNMHQSKTAQAFIVNFSMI